MSGLRENCPRVAHRSARRGACALFVLLASCSQPTRPPNILLISIDTLRADHLGAYGYGRDTSPAIDAIARAGTLFENAWSTTTWTLPSHVSMFTGLPISAHAQCDFDLEATTSVRSHLPRGRFVSEALAGAGYELAGFYSCIYLEPKFGFGEGFGTWERAYHSYTSEPGVAERWRAARASGDVEAMRRIHSENPQLWDQEVRTTPVAVDSALRWLEQRAGASEPFFLFLHVYDAHTPYTPPEPFAARFDPDYRGTIDGRQLGGSDSPFHAGMDPRDLEHVIALYDGEIAALDHDLARLFDHLERSGAAENTLVILTSDHGEEFFEHGGKLHGGQLYRETLQVPLIVKWPGRVPAGARRGEPVGLIDIAPSLRAAAGLGPDSKLPGLDLVEIANGRGSREGRSLTAELVIRRGVEEPVWISALIDGREHTTIRRCGADNWSAERFDLTLDPRERAAPERLDASHPKAAFLLAQLESERRELQRLRELAAPRELADAVVLPEERQRIRSLGYGGDAASGAFSVERLCFDGCIWRP